MTTCIYWHRNDLRIHDNECLHRCVQDYDLVIPLYIVDPHHYRVVKAGFMKSGIIRYRYLCDTISVLRDSYQKLGGQLFIRRGNSATVIKKLLGMHKVDAIIYQTEVASEEVKEEQEVRNVAEKYNCKIENIWGKTLYHLDDIPYKAETIPLTSKAFRINTSKATKPRELIATPKSITTPEGLNAGVMPSDHEMGYSEEEINSNSRSPHPAGEVAALKRLNYYSFETQLLTSYKWTRNKSLGMDYSSKLSPYLALGSISPRQIYHEIKRYEQEIKRNISTWWLVFEVVWRDYFIFKTLRIGSSLFYAQGFKHKKIAWSYDKELFKRWKEGNTGIPFLDAHQVELSSTGFMSNRGRVNSASFFTRDYKLDWRWGAAWFEHCLIDYDVYANWMNWHTQAFEIYYTNPVHQAMKYDKDGKYTLSWLPDLAKMDHSDFHAPWLYSDLQLREMGITTYRRPVEIYKKWGRAINNITKVRIQ